MFPKSAVIAALALLLAACNDDSPRIGGGDAENNGATNTDVGATNNASDMGHDVPDSTTTPDMPTQDMAGDDMTGPDMGAPDVGAPDMTDPDMVTTCTDEELLCAGVCAACPSATNVDSFVCNGVACEVETCAMGFEPCDTGCCPPARPATSGRAAAGDFTALDTSIAVDPDGYPRIVYRNFFNTNIEQSAWDGRQWVTEVIETGTNPFLTNVRVDGNGLTHASWWDFGPEALRYARETATGWQVETVASPISGHNSLALDSQNRPHLVYQDEAQKILKHSRWDGTMWVTTDIYVNNPGSLYNYPQIEVDSMDRPRVAFVHSSDFSVHYAAWDGAAWQVETVPTAGLSLYVDLAFDAADTPFIVFRELNLLRIARKPGATWMVDVVDPTASWGRTSTIRIDSAGYPRILTHNNGQDVGRVFSFDGSAWQTVDILGGAEINEGASMVLDANDAMHVGMGTKTPPVHLEYQLIP